MGGGPQNVSDLVVFGVILAVGIALGLGVKIFVIDRGKGSANWLPGQHYEIRRPNGPVRQREKYVDPLANLNPLYVITGFVVLIALVFLFYFVSKGGMAMGN
jgi:hypothetical protein